MHEQTHQKTITKAMKHVLKQRLLARDYPEQLIDKTAATISHKDKDTYRQPPDRYPRPIPPSLLAYHFHNIIS